MQSIRSVLTEVLLLKYILGSHCCKNVTKIPKQINDMTKDLKTDLTKVGGALNEAEKSIEDGKNKLQDSIDGIIQDVSCYKSVRKSKLPVIIVGDQR